MDDPSHRRNTVVGVSSPTRTNGERSSKKPRESSVDRISELPDLVLVHILSFLPMDAAIRTGVLSKRFAYKWVSTPNLLFDEGSEWARKDGFITFVNRTLLLHDPNCKVQKFTIHMDCISEGLDEDSVTLWLRFATRKGVEDLNLAFSDDVEPRDSRGLFYRYWLPQFIFRHSSFKRLATRFCQFVTYGVVSWTWLKSLSIGYAELNEEAIQNILMGSPALVFLKLHRCRGFARINICSGSLKKLSIIEPGFPNDEESEIVLEVSEVSAPNIRSLELSGIWRNMCRLPDMSSLVNAKLDIEMVSQLREFQYLSEGYSNTLREILKKLSHVENLTVGTWCLEVLSLLEMKSMPSPLSKHRYLILDCVPKKWHLPGIANLLKSSPDLEKLHLHLNTRWAFEFWNHQDFNNYYNYGDTYGESFWASEEKCFECHLQNLKIIKIVDFDPGHCDIQFAIAFIEFLLKNAKVLEKMVINVLKVKRQSSYAALENSVVQKLLSFTRASPRAAVLFLK